MLFPLPRAFRPCSVVHAVGLKGTAYPVRLLWRECKGGSEGVTKPPGCVTVGRKTRGGSRRTLACFSTIKDSGVLRHFRDYSSFSLWGQNTLLGCSGLVSAMSPKKKMRKLLEGTELEKEATGDGVVPHSLTDNAGIVVKASCGEKQVEGDTEKGGIGALAEAVKEARVRTAPSVAAFKFNKKRVRLVSQVSDLEEEGAGILYWMSRDQRVQDNWAFLYAQSLALKQKVPLHVCFCLVPKFLDATIRQFGFLLRGLKEVSEECRELNIPFHLLLGSAKDVLPHFVTKHGISGIVTDFAPLRVPMQWVQDVRERLPPTVPFVQVDAHNIVPCWVASDKQEYGARTIRRKIHDRLAEFLTEFPPVIRHPYTSTVRAEPIDWDGCYASLQVDCSVKEVGWATPGTASGLAMLERFIRERLKLFGTDRNNPNKPALSNLSPWFHFGQVAVQRAILEVRKHRHKYKEAVESFVEEAVVRRELADNFCFYNQHYDRVEGAAAWAKTTLTLHAKDKRPYVYTLKQLEEGKTHDPLWNAAQLQMVHEGKMHGFLRMYWAKKILEWTSSPEEALKFSIYLNDRYELDGRDPNGYVGCMWSICGIHDQGWAERAVFGKIRYMNYAGCKRKFDVHQFECKYSARKLSQKPS